MHLEREFPQVSAHHEYRKRNDKADGGRRGGGGQYERAKQRLLARLENPPDLGTNGKITWTRDEIHERT